MLNEGDYVRVKANPGRQGIITGNVKSLGGVDLYEVRFPDKFKFHPEDQLELIEEEIKAIDALKKGRLGKVSDLRRNITYHRLNSRLENLIYSMQTTNTDFYAYQFKPVIKFLNAPRNGILIADEVGLGKTIEAGLIWTELRSRFDSKRIMVVCPAVLREKWQNELDRRFGVKSQIVNANETLSMLQKSENDEDYSFAIIGSIQGLRPNKKWDEEEQENGVRENSSQLATFLSNRQNELSLIDLLIIDEAHYLRNPGTATSDIGNLLKGVSDHIILISATPIHLQSKDLYQLLKLLDEDTFSREEFFHDIVEANEPLIAARDNIISNKLTKGQFLDLLSQAKKSDILKNNRQLQSLIDDPPSDEELANIENRSNLAHRIDKMNLLNHLISRTRKREVVEWKVIREAFPESIELTQEEYDFYQEVTNTVRYFCQQHSFPEGFLLTMPQRLMASSIPAALYQWQKRKNEILDNNIKEDIYEDIGDFAYDQDVDPGPVTRDLLENAEQLGDYWTLRKNDSKYKRLFTILSVQIKNNPNEKVVLFSYFRGTLTYLNERLKEDNISCILLMGGRDKYEIVNEFQKDDGPNVLLSSEIGSEGIDLQFAKLLINYDLPWNPMRVEQRIGRLDRLGQLSRKVKIWNLFASQTIEERIYYRLFSRLKIFEKSLGGLEEILGQQVSKLTKELLSYNLTPEEEERCIDQYAYAIETKRLHEERLENESSTFLAYGDYILNQIKGAKQQERWIRGEDLYIYVKDFFDRNYNGCIFNQLKENILQFKIHLSNKAKLDLENYCKANNIKQYSKLLMNNQKNFTYNFINKVGDDHSYREEIINQFHPVIQFINGNIDYSKEFYPAVSLKFNTKKNNFEITNIDLGYYVFVIHKWTINGLQDKDILNYVMINFDNQDTYKGDLAEYFLNNAALYGEDWPECTNLINLYQAASLTEACEDISWNDFLSYKKQVEDENNDRADIQLENLNKHLSNQLEKLYTLRNKHYYHNRTNLIKATDGKINALYDRVERKKLDIESKKNIHYDLEPIAIGLLNLF